MLKTRIVLLCVIISVMTTPLMADLMLSPSSQAVTVGDSFEVALNISGLVTGQGPSLGAYDIEVAFDPAVLAYSGAVFGDPLLGNQLDIFSLGFNPQDEHISADMINLAEVSLDFASDLDDFQEDSFTLATITFDAIAAGTSILDITSWILSDSLGDPMFPATISDASVTVNAVPVPGAFTLGILGIGYGMRKLRRRREL